MQKKAKNASILLYSIFLSLALMIAFLSLNSNLQKNLNENLNIIASIENNNKKNEVINNAIATGNYDNTNLESEENIIFESDNYLSLNLKKEEETNINLNEDSNITIKIIEGSPVEYGVDNSSGVIVNMKTFKTEGKNIKIKNLGGYSSLQVWGENKFEKKNKKYRITRDLSNRNIIVEESYLNQE